MAKFSDVEAQLLERVTDDRLRTSLGLIRQAMEDIWAADAPRIIQDYTEHGAAHSERLAGFAAKLLEANDGRDLSAREMYLLLAGIYLHDIGMQCDVVRSPQVKERAEGLGADFGLEFTANTSSTYSLNEQKAIRKNHGYLSGAWLDYAFRTGHTVLGVSAQSTPDDLVDDLMDVCKHHTKLSIADCPRTFKFDPTGRKQLVAALLRFCDELDIDNNRVSIETVKNFSLDPRNSVYWWVHHQTKVLFSARSLILLTVRLHPDDLDDFGSFVQEAFITEFQAKNRALLSVLAQNNIPIVFSDDSKVVEDDRVEPLPPEILEALRAIQKRPDHVLELTKEVLTWLPSIRYEVSDPQRQDIRTADVVATMEQGPVKQRVLVRCVDGEIVPSDVDKVDALLDRNIPQGWLISYKRVSPRARERASKDDALQVFNLPEFLEQMIWGPYFERLRSLVEKDRIPDLYVEQCCYKQEMDQEGREIARDTYASLTAYIDACMSEPGKTHISLLGEFGMGKTWFCRHYAYRQLKRYLNDPFNERMPLLITLRGFSKAMTAQQLINDALLEQYRLPFVGSAFQVFQEMNRRGKLLLLLDGFDEMARKVDYQTVVDNFWELARLVDKNSKIILTSRTEYFRWAIESEKVLSGREFARDTILLSPPSFEVVHLESFNNDQIHDLITRHLGSEEGTAVSETVLSDPNLAEIARKPVLIELLLATLNVNEIQPGSIENPSQIYLYATSELLLRNIETRRTFSTTADKLYFLCELAWDMIKKDDLRIHYTVLPDRIKAYFGDRIKGQHELDVWDYDLRNQTLLHRDASGYYEFAHKSLAEYFVAFKFSAELGCLSDLYADLYFRADIEPPDLPLREKGVSDLADTFGLIPLTHPRMRTICSFIVKMIDLRKLNRLWDILENTKDMMREAVGYTGGNVATLLRISGESFLGTDLATSVLTGADLSDSDLSRINLRAACLREAKLTNCVLAGADLRDADLMSLQEVYNESPASCLEWSVDGKLLAAGMKNGRVCIWDTATWKLQFTLHHKEGFVVGICFDPQGKLIAALGWSSVKVWRIEDRSECVTIRVQSPEYLWQSWVDGDEEGCLRIGRISFDAAVFEETGEEIKKAAAIVKKHLTRWKNSGSEALGRHSLDERMWARLSQSIRKRPVEIWSYGPKVHLYYRADPVLVVRSKDINIPSEISVVPDKPLKIILSVALHPEKALVTIGGLSATIEIWDILNKDSTFQRCIKTLKPTLICNGLKVSGAIGLEQDISWNAEGEFGRYTLLEFFEGCGAILDEDQKRIVAETRRQREKDQEFIRTEIERQRESDGENRSSE